MLNLSSSKPVLTVTLNPSIDTIISFQRENKHLRMIKQFEYGAGKGVNVSRTLKAFKVPTIAIGLIGGDNGIRIRKLLDRERIDHRFVSIRANSRRNVSLVESGKGVFNRIFQQSPRVQTNEFKEFVKVYRDLLGQSSMVILSGRTVCGVSEDVFYDLIQAAHRSNIRVCLDSSGRSFKRGLKAKPWMIKPNRDEVYQATGINIKNIPDGVKAIKFFKRMGLQNVLISLGADGAIGCNHDDLWYAKALKIECISSVGCGDAFVGSFCSEYLRNSQFESSFRLAIASGSVNTSSIIPGGIQSSTARQLATTIKLKKIKI